MYPVVPGEDSYVLHRYVLAAVQVVRPVAGVSYRVALEADVLAVVEGDPVRSAVVLLALRVEAVRAVYYRRLSRG